MQADEALREARLSGFFDQAAAGMSETDSTGRFLRVNDRYCDITGRTREELLSMRMQDITHPDDLPGNIPLFLDALEHGRGFDIEKRYVRPDGTIVWVHNSVTAIREPDGRVAHTVCVTIDISDRKAAEEQLRRNQETFYNLIKNDPFGVYVVDADFKLAVVSRGSEKVFETVKPLIGRDFAEVLRAIWDEPFASEAIERFHRTLDTGEPYASQRTVERRSDIGDVEAYDWRIERIVLPDGRHGVVCYFYDLSDRLRWEEVIRDASERVELALDAGAIAGTWVWHVPTDHFTGDERFARSFGLDPDQCREGIPLSAPFEQIHPDDRSRVREILEGVLKSGGDYRAEYRVRQPDGQYRWVEAVGRCELDESGTPLRFPGVLVDIDLRKRDEAALAESEEKHRRIFEQTSDLIFTADLDQVITACNPAAAEAIGLSQKEAVGRNISDFISADDLELTRRMLREKLERGGTTRYELRVHKTNGEWRYWEINSGLTFDGAGEPVGLHVVGRDITERKRLERQQQILVAELNHRVKNTLAIVQSIAHQTFRKGSPPGDAISGFEGRLSALAAAHNLLTAQNWEAASIEAVVGAALAPFCSPDRCDIDGPEIALPPQTAVSLSLAVHELATNAAKYGALSNSSGRVSIEWRIDSERIELWWRERGGPPVESPTKAGFGTKMIKRTLAAEFRGEVELDFASDGLTCRVVGPLPQAPA